MPESLKDKSSAVALAKLIVAVYVSLPAATVSVYTILSPKDVVAEVPLTVPTNVVTVFPSTTAPFKVPAVNVCVVTGSSPCAAPGVVVTMVTPSREKTPAPSLVPVVAEITTTVPSALVCVDDASAIEKTVPALVSEKVTGLVASALSIATVPSSVRSATAAFTASLSAPLAAVAGPLFSAATASSSVANSSVAL